MMTADDIFQTLDIVTMTRTTYARMRNAIANAEIQEQRHADERDCMRAALERATEQLADMTAERDEARLNIVTYQTVANHANRTALQLADRADNAALRYANAIRERDEARAERDEVQKQFQKADNERAFYHSLYQEYMNEFCRMRTQFHELQAAHNREQDRRLAAERDNEALCAELRAKRA